MSRERFEDAAPHSDLEFGGVLGRDALRPPVTVVFDDPLCIGDQDFNRGYQRQTMDGPLEWVNCRDRRRSRQRSCRHN